MTETPTVAEKTAVRPGAKALLALISVYRYAISPLLPARCRYFPTCSAYASEAIHRHGAVRGGWLTVKRLGRCHPWGSHGHDPVPAVLTPSSHCCKRKP